MQPFLTEAIPEGSRISNVLKCINQGVVAPAVMSLRLQTAGKINFKDCRGEWNIVIRFQKGDGVHISHLKVNYSHASKHYIIVLMCLSSERAIIARGI